MSLCIDVKLLINTGLKSVLFRFMFLLSNEQVKDGFCLDPFQFTEITLCTGKLSGFQSNIHASEFHFGTFILSVL